MTKIFAKVKQLAIKEKINKFVSHLPARKFKKFQGDKQNYIILKDLENIDFINQRF